MTPYIRDGFHKQGPWHEYMLNKSDLRIHSPVQQLKDIVMNSAILTATGYAMKYWHFMEWAFFFIQERKWMTS